MAHTYGMGEGSKILYRGELTVRVEDGKYSVLLYSNSPDNDFKTERELKAALSNLEDEMNGL